MPNINSKLSLTDIPLTSTPVPLIAPGNCTSVELTASVDWGWSTELNGTYQVVSANTRYTLLDNAFIRAGSPLCYVWSVPPNGTMWILCRRQV